MEYSPSNDIGIYQQFSKKTLKDKSKNKESFCEEVGLPYEKKVPLLAITYPLTDVNGVQKLQDIMNGILEQPTQIVLTGIGNDRFQKYFTKLAEENPDRVVIVPNDDAECRKIYAAADIVLISSKTDECLEQARHAMSYGAVPVIEQTDFVEDYNPNQERGNAFVCPLDSPWSMFATLIRALENYKFPYDWGNISASAMETME